ncbi:3-oxoacyl-ACP synthase III family protein [Flavobacterium yafengii]|uniref:Ketoacyl-ACP synthase III n=1 Tax=Flavobacterium yafengii TaxID=3041253 RepID=A0AAW6TTL7_9FLAO|nr:ketoacyl-ACP synthase III [Flavobacterium yafengii]MDI5950750.1 ketoacyl-ACP synthase III [Flavobacterium yafengii]
MGVVIKHIEYYLPEKVITNIDLAKNNPEWNIEKIEEKSGVKKRHIAEPNETALDLAIKAVEKIFSSSVISKDDIDAVIFCTQSHDYVMPANSFLIHKHFNFKQSVWTFDYNLACSGYIFGLAITRGILETGLAKNVLLINSETYSKYINLKDRSTSILFGDGAAVSVISMEDFGGIVDVILSSSGEKFDSFYIPAGGMRTPKSDDTKKTIIDDSGNVKCLENIHMNGFAVWQFISKNVSEQISTLLERNHLNVDDIDLYVFHQASKLTLDSLVKSLKLDRDKVFLNLENVGNTVSASVPIALKDAELNGKLKRGDLVLLSGFGVGLSWGSIIMRY